MTNPASLAARIHARFPEGLTGIFVLGATRTAYLLEYTRNTDHPGELRSFEHYAEYSLRKTREIILTFFELGGKNIIIPTSSYNLLEDKRGPEYIESSIIAGKRLINDDFKRFYIQEDIDPYFAGIDTLLHLPEDTLQHDLGRVYDQFHKDWAYREGRNKLIWEVAPIPLFTFRYVDKVLGTQDGQRVDSMVNAETSYNRIVQLLYEYFARASYNTLIPMPQLYVASNRNGDLKMRAVLPPSLDPTGEMRMYFTPYPSFFMTPKTIIAVLEDLVVDKRIRSYAQDYKNQLTTEQLRKMYEAYKSLAEDPQTTLGLTQTPLNNASG